MEHPEIFTNCIKAHLPWNFYENPFSRFSVMLLTDKQTNRQATDNDENITFAMAEVNIESRTAREICHNAREQRPDGWIMKPNVT